MTIDIQPIGTQPMDPSCGALCLDHLLVAFSFQGHRGSATVPGRGTPCDSALLECFYRRGFTGWELNPMNGFLWDETWYHLGKKE